MKCGAFFFTWLLIGSVTAQDSAAHRSRWSIGINGSPDVAYRKLEIIEPSEIASSIVDGRNERELPVIGVTAALMGGYSFNDRFGIEAGVGYALLGWEIDLSELSFGDQIDPRRGFAYSTDPALQGLKTLRQQFHYLNFPIKGTVTVGKRRWRWISSAGISFGIMMRARNVIIYEDDRSSWDQDYYERFNLFAQLSTGVLYQLSDRHQFRLEPTFRYGLLPIINDTPITGYLWSVGFNVGWYRSF